MNFLSIDCCTVKASLFIKTKNKTFNKVLQSDKSNNDLLMVQILDFFKENKLEFEDISNIFVNQGPGNFSGLRASIAIAKGVSISKNLNLFGYNTFLWSCAKFFNKKDFIYSIVRFRDRYFIKKFDTNLNDILKAEEISVGDIISKHEKNLKIINKDEIKYFDKKILDLSNISPIDLDHNDLEFLKIKGLLSEKSIKPLYLS